MNATGRDADLQWWRRRASQKWFRQYWQRNTALSGNQTTPRASSAISTSEPLPPRPLAPLLLPLPLRLRLRNSCERIIRHYVACSLQNDENKTIRICRLHSRWDYGAWAIPSCVGFITAYQSKLEVNRYKYMVQKNCCWITTVVFIIIKRSVDAWR